MLDFVELQPDGTARLDLNKVSRDQAAARRGPDRGWRPRLLLLQPREANVDRAPPTTLWPEDREVKSVDCSISDIDSGKRP